jgi:hypothetical protein
MCVQPPNPGATTAGGGQKANKQGSKEAGKQSNKKQADKKKPKKEADGKKTDQKNPEKGTPTACSNAGGGYATPRVKCDELKRIDWNNPKQAEGAMASAKGADYVRENYGDMRITSQYRAGTANHGKGNATDVSFLNPGNSGGDNWSNYQAFKNDQGIADRFSRVIYEGDHIHMEARVPGDNRPTVFYDRVSGNNANTTTYRTPFR